MTRRRAYRATNVKKVSINRLKQDLAKGPLWVGLDVGKKEVFVVVRDNTGYFARPWRVRQPSEIKVLVERLRELADRREAVVAMESTGTYGDALRQALTDAAMEIHRVSGKATSDYKEIFDGVPSSHDGKDAAVIAELASIGKSRPWPYQDRSKQDAEIAMAVDWLDTQQDILQMWQGRLEALLSRHWPEATRILKLTSATLLRVLLHYGGPAALADDKQAEEQLARWGGPFLKPEKIRRLIASARATVGVRMNEADHQQMQRYAKEARLAAREIAQTNRRLEQLAAGNETIRRQAEVVGIATACVLWVSVGDPANYPCGNAYRKAMGLNLKERSSGKHKGKLKITKRGPSIARRWLFFAGMRILQKPPVRRWYEAKKCKDGDHGIGAVIGVTRKLVLALHAVGTHGARFEAWRLFPGRSLGAKTLRRASVEGQS